MAQPAFRAAGTASHTNGGSVPTPGLPSGTAEGDILLLHVIVGNNNAIIECSTFTAIAYDDGTNLRSAWFWKRAGSSETAPTISITNNSAYAGARIYGFSGCVATGTPYEDATKVAQTASTAVASSTVTTTGTDRLAVCLAGVEDDTSWTGHPPSGWTSHGVSASNIGTDGRLAAIGYNSNPGSGADVSAVTVGTLSGSEYWSTLTLLLIPVAVQTFSGSVATATSQSYTGTLEASGTVTFSGAAATSTGQSYTGTVTATGAATFAGSAAAATAQAYDGTLEGTLEPQTFVGQVATATGQAHSGTLTATGTVAFSGAVATATSQVYTGTITATGAVTFYGPAALAFCDAWGGTLTASGTATFSGSAATATSQAYDGQLSGAGIFVGDAATASAAAHDGTLSASGTATFSGSAATATGAAHSGTLTASGTVTFSGSAATATGQAYTGTITATGSAEFAGAPAEATLVAYDGTLSGWSTEPQTFVGICATASASAFDGALFRLDDSLNRWLSWPRGLLWEVAARELAVPSLRRGLLWDVGTRETAIPAVRRQNAWMADPS